MDSGFNVTVVEKSKKNIQCNSSIDIIVAIIGDGESFEVISGAPSEISAI